MIFSTFTGLFPSWTDCIITGMEISFNHSLRTLSRIIDCPRWVEASIGRYLTGICPFFFFLSHPRSQPGFPRTIESPSWNRSSLANDAGDSENQENVQRRRRTIRRGQTPLTPAFAYRRVTWFLGHAISSPTPLSFDSRIRCDLKPLNPLYI